MTGRNKGALSWLMAMAVLMECATMRIEACDTNYMALRYEGDVFPEDNVIFPGGDGILTYLDSYITGQHALKLLTPLDQCTFAAIDSAPPETLGDGAITVCDFVNSVCLETRNRQPILGVGGPAVPLNLVPAAGVGARKLLISATNLLWGEEAVLDVVLDGAGDEMGAGFTLEFDATALQYRSISLPGLWSLANTNEAANGRIAALMSTMITNLPAGKSQIAQLHFGVTNWACTNLTFQFSDVLAKCEVASSNAYPLATTFQNTSYTVTNAVFKLAQPQSTGSGVKLLISSRLNTHFSVEASTNLHDWAPLVTLTNTVGIMPYVDPAATGLNRRFYRAVAVP